MEKSLIFLIFLDETYLVASLVLWLFPLIYSMTAEIVTWFNLLNANSLLQAKLFFLQKISWGKVCRAFKEEVIKPNDTLMQGWSIFASSIEKAGFFKVKIHLKKAWTIHSLQNSIVSLFVQKDRGAKKSKRVRILTKISCRGNKCIDLIAFDFFVAFKLLKCDILTRAKRATDEYF